MGEPFDGMGLFVSRMFSNKTITFRILLTTYARCYRWFFDAQGRLHAGHFAQVPLQGGRNPLLREAGLGLPRHRAQGGPYPTQELRC